MTERGTRKFTRWHHDALPEVGGYRSTSVLGEHGTVCAFKAETMDDERRPVMLTVLDPRLCSHEREETQFIESARQAIGLVHPNILALLDTGRCEKSGMIYAANEWTAGQNLDAFLDGKHLQDTDAVAVCQGIMEALSAAGQRRLSHGMLRAGNVIIDSSATPRVTGLCLGKPKESQPGLAHCLAPEQVTSLDSGGTPADLYAVGVLFYLCLTGVYPFQGDTYQELAERRLGAGVPDPREQEPRVSEHAANLVRWLCASEPRARYQAAHTASLDFLRVMAGRPPKGPKASRLKSSDQLTELLLEVAGGGDMHTPRGLWGKGSAYSFKVRVSSRDNVLDEHAFNSEVLDVGRSPDCDLFIDNPIVSRKHARLRRIGAHFVLEAVAKTNSTVLGKSAVRGKSWFLPGVPITLSEKFRLRISWAPGAVPDAARPAKDASAFLLSAPTKKFRVAPEVLPASVGNAVSQAPQTHPAGRESVQAGSRPVLVYSRQGNEVRAVLQRPLQLGHATCCDVRLSKSAPYKVAIFFPGGDEQLLYNLTSDPSLVTLNGDPVHDLAVLEPGDEIEVAGFNLRLELD